MPKPAAPAETAQQTKKPSTSALSQQMFFSDMSAQTSNLLGVFNPKIVTHQTRLLMRDDPDVAFGLAILEAPIVNMEWSIESHDTEISAFVEAALRPVYRQLATSLCMSIPFGVSVTEKVWKSVPLNVRGEGEDVKKFPAAWVIERAKAISLSGLAFVVDAATDDWTAVEQAQKGKKVTVGRDQVVLWPFRREKVYGNLHGYAMLNQTYEPWWWKAFMQLTANRYFERKAEPGTKARGAAEIEVGGVTKNGYDYLADQLRALRAGGVAVLPSLRDSKGEYVFDIELLADDKRGDMLQQRIDSLSIQIMRSLWITDKAATNTGDRGSLSQAEQHAEVLASLIGMLVAEFASIVNEQVIMQIATYNFGEERARDANPRLKSAGLSSEMKTIMGDVMKTLLQAESALADGSKVTLADRLDAGGIAKQLGLPLKSEGQIAEEAKAREARAAELQKQMQENPPEPAPPDEAAAAAKIARVKQAAKVTPGE